MFRVVESLLLLYGELCHHIIRDFTFLGKTYRRFAYRKIDGIIGGVVNNLGIKDHDLSKSLTKELTKTTLTEPGYHSVPTLLADMAVTILGKLAMILLHKRRKR